MTFPVLPTDPQARLEALVAILLDRSSRYRHQAIGELGSMGEIAVLPLIDLLQSSDDPVVRAGLPIALERLQDPRGFDPVLRLLTDEDAEVREAAYLALWDFKDLRSVPALILALQ